MKFARFPRLFSARAEGVARPFEVGRSIDTEGNRVNERHVDPHAGLKGAQLLQAFAALQGARPYLLPVPSRT